ncbi:hypothetical protein [Antrihabitans spumae]|uniref:Uncharacterized protein n=1 Tax=Antrihabitans spumae TaxID=3373370 RepID=A0ABW7K8U7_9NOCA
MTAAPPLLQWRDPVMASDDPDGESAVDSLLRAGFESPESALFVLSEGFDPRCLSALRRFVAAVGVPRVVAVDPQPPSSPGESLTLRHREQHTAELNDLVGDRLVRLPYPEVHDASSVGRVLAQQLTDTSMLEGVTAVAFDVSAFPTSLSFPPLRALLDVCGQEGAPSELQVLVTANPQLDHSIHKASLGVPHMLAGFRPRGTDKRVRVWTPVLGVRGKDTLSRIAEFIGPREVCPILPFPALDPRLPDEILDVHRELLLDRYEIGPNNLIYAAEGNPFDLYRTLARFNTDYKTTLEPLGGALVHISVHGSKLLSIGALLAAYEFELPIVAMRANRYSVADDQYVDETRAGDRLTALWLRGQPYVR